MRFVDFLLGRPAVEDFSAEAVVQGEAPLVPVYRDDGRVARVAPDDLATWLADGWRQTSLDLNVAVSSLGPRFAACQLALGVLAAGAARDGEIGAADLLAAESAVGEVANALHEVLISARTGYPVAQPPGVAMVAPSGAVVAVDPNQVEHHRRRGWREEQP